MTVQAMKKAEKYGIGIAIMRGSNHFVGSAAYTLMAAERGMLGIAMSNTESIMAAPESKDKVIGNNPWGFAVPTGAGFPLLLDICNAYASFGKFWLYRKNKWKIPPEWGLDGSGKNTTDPAKVIDGGIPLPMAGHKGFGIAILVELLTSVLSGGTITDEVRHPNGKGKGFSQAALVIDIGHFMPVSRFKERTKRMIRHLKKHPVRGGGKIELPGERSHRAKQRLMKTGIRLGPSLRRKLESWL
jgi:LDH2 family malate/lactate/ureidoglycolate dehydrogenase